MRRCAISRVSECSAPRPPYAAVLAARTGPGGEDVDEGGAQVDGLGDARMQCHRPSTRYAGASTGGRSSVSPRWPARRRPGPGGDQHVVAAEQVGGHQVRRHPGLREVVDERMGLEKPSKLQVEATPALRPSSPRST